MKFRILLVILLTIFASAVGAKQQPANIVKIGEELTLMNIQDKVMYLPIEKSYEIDNVLSQYHNNDFLNYQTLEIPDGKSSVWLSVVLENKSLEQKDIFIGTSLFDYLEIYSPSESSFDVYKGGILESNKNKEYKKGSFSFGKVSLPASSKRRVYLKGTYTNGQYFQFTALPFTVYDAGEFNKLYEPQDMFHFLFTGAMLIMVFYNLFLYIIVKDKTYILYVGYNIAIAIYCLGLSGFISEKMLPSAFLQEDLVNVPGMFGYFFYILFAQHYLKLKEFYPKANKVLNYTLIGICISMVMFISGFRIPSIVYNFLAAGTGYPLVIILAYQRAKNSDSSKYFFIAGISYIISIGVSIMQMLEILPPYIWLFNSANLTEVGVILELSLFSLGLGERINEARREVLRKEEEKKELIEAQNRDLENKVKERTFELEEMNQELATMNEELSSTMETVYEQNKVIEQKNENITQSINYAKRIQSAMMPTKEYLSKFFRDHFVFFKPRDIVSGDFYWAYHLENKTDFFIAVVDCTGHGVPGGFMSMLGSELLRDVIEHRKESDPGKILYCMNEGIEQALKQSDSRNKDGMDMSLLKVNLKERKIYYAGAKRPLVIVKSNGEIEVVQGSKLSIGGMVRKDLYSYDTSTIEVDFGDKFYIFSDGYPDQIGGPMERKFMTKRFRNLLKDISHLPMQEQSKILDETLKEWMSTFSYGQVDDVIVIGFEI